MTDNENRHYNPELDPGNPANPKGFFHGNKVAMWLFVSWEAIGLLTAIWLWISLGPIVAGISFVLWTLGLVSLGLGGD